MNGTLRRSSRCTIALELVLVLVSGIIRLAAQDAKDRYTLPPQPIQDFINKDKNLVTLDRLSPDGDHFLVSSTTELSTLQLMSQKIYRLAMLKVTPDTNRELDHSTYGAYALKIYSLKERTARAVKLPAGTFVSDMTWSPDGSKLAFLAHLPKRSEVWVADAQTAEAKPLSDAAVMATLAKRPEFGRAANGPSRIIQWTPDGSVITLLVPAGRGPEPAYNPVPASPMIRRSPGKPTPTATLPFLLQTPRDGELFRYYTTSQAAILSPGQPPRMIGQPAMYLSVSASPDGKYLLADKLVEPFSYLVGFSDFGHNVEVMDMTGATIATVAKIPLREGLRNDGSDTAGSDLPRDIAWRPDGKGLTFLALEERKKGEGDSDAAADRKDRILSLAPPFNMTQVQTLASGTRRFSDVAFSRDGKYVFATQSDRPRAGSRKHQDIAAFDLSSGQSQPTYLVRDSDPDDLVNLPGTLATDANGNGIEFALISSAGDSAYLEGNGYKADFRPRPFVDRVAIRTGEKRRLFEGSPEMFEKPLVPLDSDFSRMIISRESKSAVPNSFLWANGSAGENLTQNPDPYPAISACQRVDFSFTRQDGLVVHARLSLPTNYREGTRVPGVFWDYPHEYSATEDYARDAIRTRNHNAYTPLSFLRWSDLWLTQGYALVYTDIPIIGKGNAYNDQFLNNLVETVYGAIRKLDQMGQVDIDRLGHGGHSYGAFTTGNLLSHTPFFKAGIAGDGAYNRTLTPMTFQQEKRFFWDAPTTYMEMSPFFYADQINTPLLMYHGGEDDNSGTFVIQSLRMMQALTGLGKKAVLYVYPFEAHSPRCKETYMDIWARWIDWFDTYVKKGDVKNQEVKTAM